MMNQSRLLQICRWLGYLSLCLFLCSWVPGCGDGSTGDSSQDTPDVSKADQGTESTATKTTSEPVAPDRDRAKPETKTTMASVGKPGFTKFDALMAGLSVFVLAVFVGFEVITKVPPTLHTPLMSGSNAISGITLVGALLVAGNRDYAAWLGIVAVIFATINVIGGFWVTHRMLSMFKR